jgi:hypothetical protein
MIEKKLINNTTKENESLKDSIDNNYIPDANNIFYEIDQN